MSVVHIYHAHNQPDSQLHMSKIATKNAVHPLSFFSIEAFFFLDYCLNDVQRDASFSLLCVCISFFVSFSRRFSSSLVFHCYLANALNFIASFVCLLGYANV